MSGNEESDQLGSTPKGVLLGVAANLVALVVSWFLLEQAIRATASQMSPDGVLVWAFWLLQLLWLLPLRRMFLNEGQAKTARGVAIAGWLTLLVNGALIAFFLFFLFAFGPRHW